MANTSFKAENGLSVTGNSQFDYTSKFNANVTVAADQWYIGGNLYVTGTQVFVGGNVAVADIIAGASGLKLGNSTYQWDGYLSNVYVYGTLLNPVGNTVQLGNSTNRWVISGNTLNISTTSTLTGAATLANTIAVTGTATFANTSSHTGAATFANTLGVTGAATFANTLGVTGAATLSNTMSVTGAANALSTFGVNGVTTLASTLSVTGAATLSNNITVAGNAVFSNAISVANAATFSNTLSVTGTATFANTTGHTGAATFSNTISVTGTSTLTGNATLSGTLQTISGNANFNGGTLFVDAGSGRVGIGTSTPDSVLTVGGPTKVNSSFTVTGTSSFANSVTFANTTTFNQDVTINANLTVTGTRTYVNTQTLDVGDNIITLNADLPGATSPTENAGIEINRGSSANSRLQWTEGTGWQLSSASVSTFYNIVNEGTSNTNLDSGTLFVDAVNNRVGINNTAPGVALRVSGAVDISSTANIQSNANVGGTLGVTGAANALSTLGVNSLLTACSGLIVTGTANVSTDLNVSGTANVSNNLNVIGQIQLGTYGTTNGVLISNTGISLGNVTHFTTQTRSQVVITAGSGVRANLTSTALFVGNTTSNAIVSGNLISISNTANLTSTTLTIGTTTVTTALINTAALNVTNQTNTATLFVTTSANVGTALTINSTALAVTPNANFDSGVLFVDAVNNRVGINNTAPGVALRVTGAVDISSTANIQSNANVGGTLGVASLLTASGGLDVSGTANVSTNLNVGGGVATTNGATITNTSILLGNSSVNTQISPSQIVIRTNATGNAYSQLSLASSDQLGGSLSLQHGNTTSNSTIVLGTQSGNNASIELGGSSAAFIDFKTPSEDDFDTRLISTTSGFNIIAGSSTSANIVNITSANVNIDAGTLFVDAVNNRVGINNTAPGVALRVTGAADISSTANVQGNANVGGTLGVASLLTAAAGLTVTGTANVSTNLNVSGTGNVQSTFGMAGAANALSTLGVNGLLTAATGLAVTGTANIFGGGGSTAVARFATGAFPASGVNIVPNATVGSFNSLVDQGDILLNFSSGGEGSGNLVIANWATNTGGIKINGLINDIALVGNSFTFTTGNSNFDSGTLFVDALNNRIGINNTAPGVALRVTGAVDISSTANIQSNANVGGTLGVTGAANALSTFGVNGLLTAAAGLTVTGTSNVSAQFNVGGGVATTNGATINATFMVIGNTTSNAIVSGNLISVSNTANLTSTTLTIGTTTVTTALINTAAINVVNQTNTATLFVTTSANVGTALTVNSSVINAAANLSMAAYTEKMTALAITTNGTTDLNLQTSSVFRVTVANTVVTSANVRFINPPATGTAVSATLILQYLGTGANSIGALAIQGNTQGGAAGTIKYAYDSAPTLTLTPAKSDILSAITYDGGATYIVAPSFMNFTT